MSYRNPTTKPHARRRKFANPSQSRPHVCSQECFEAWLNAHRAEVAEPLPDAERRARTARALLAYLESLR